VFDAAAASDRMRFLPAPRMRSRCSPSSRGGLVVLLGSIPQQDVLQRIVEREG
jgi:hypothetical protein